MCASFFTFFDVTKHKLPLINPIADSQADMYTHTHTCTFIWIRKMDIKGNRNENDRDGRKKRFTSQFSGCVQKCNDDEIPKKN
jgi:hypothetical protein